MTVPALDTRYTRYAKQWAAEAAVHAILLLCCLAAAATGQLVAGITQTVFTVLPSPAPATLQTLAKFTSSLCSIWNRWMYLQQLQSPCDLQWCTHRCPRSRALVLLVP